eukprot:144053-Hanusia_phi.AAC.5
MNHRPHTTPRPGPGPGRAMVSDPPVRGELANSDSEFPSVTQESCLVSGLTESAFAAPMITNSEIRGRLNSFRSDKES